MKAHQRIIREKKAKEISQDLYGKFWENINLEDVSLVGTILNSKETYNPDIVSRVENIIKETK